MDELITWFSKPENVINITGHALSTLLGALFAFLIGTMLYRHQKNHDNLGYLQYAISSLTAVSNNLYLFKKQFVLERYEEAVLIEGQLNNPEPNEQGIVNLEIREMTKVMFASSVDLNISLERMHFLTNRDPNVILILGVMASSIGSLNSIVFAINKYIDEMMKDTYEDGPPTFLVNITKNLLPQVDSTLYLVNKCIELLIMYGSIEYKGKMRIKGQTLTQKEYTSLKPDPIESWEERQWFRPKKAWYQTSWFAFCDRRKKTD